MSVNLRKFDLRPLLTPSLSFLKNCPMLSSSEFDVHFLPRPPSSSVCVYLPITWRPVLRKEFVLLLPAGEGRRFHVLFAICLTCALRCLITHRLAKARVTYKCLIFIHKHIVWLDPKFGGYLFIIQFLDDLGGAIKGQVMGLISAHLEIIMLH